MLEILRNLFDLVFPNQCVICGENLQPTEHVLLVDDVLTTGSTLIACVQALKKSNCEVSIFTLASA